MSRYILAALFCYSFMQATARAGTFDSALPALVAVLPGQADSDAARKQVDDLLGRARQAMNEGNLETADSLVGRAEGLNVAYGMFHTGDTPKKVRRDLEKAREARGGKPAAADPFAGRTPTTLAAATGNAPLPMSPLPPTGADAAGAPTSYGMQVPQFASPPPGYNTAAPGSVLPLPGAQPSDVRLLSGEPAALPAGPATATNDPARKQQVIDLVRQARGALAAGDLVKADYLAKQADAMGVPDKEFGPQDDRAWLVLMEIEKQQRGGVVQATAQMPAGGAYAGSQAVYNPAQDTTQNMQVAAQAGAPTLAPIASVPLTATPIDDPGTGEAIKALEAGEAALRRRDMNAARNYFAQAQAQINELDPVSRQRLQDRLSLLGGESIAPGRAEGGLLDQTTQAQALQARQVTSEVARLEQQSRELQANDPNQAQAVLQQARVIVERSSIDAGTKELMIRRLDRDLAELNRYVEANRPLIELSRQNAEVKATLDREQQNKLDNQSKLAQLVEEYNMLVDQQRFAEAEVLAKRAADIAPNEPIAAQLAVQSKALRRMYNNADIASRKENNINEMFARIEESSITTDESIQFPKGWAELRGKRGPINGDSRRRSPKELEIEQKLRTPVSLKFANAPMAQVFEKLSAMTGVPIYLDNRGIAAEGVDSSTPVTIDLSTEISLKSALNLILAEHHLTYVIKNEVLKITSDRMRSEEVYPVTYAVGDLIIPIPNFTPSGSMGMAGALAEAQARLTGGMGLAGNMASMPGHTPIAVSTSSKSQDVLGQMAVPFASGGGGPPSTGQAQNVPFGPGGMGGGVQPDFDSLIELMTSTIEPETWREAGGTQGEVRPHHSTLSLVITQTQAVHEQIEDLLNQLRQLQDLQVTIEVRFIQLRDDFYEQIGIDFDMDINDNADVPFQIFGRPNRNDAATQTNGANFTAANALAKDSANPPRDVQDRDSGQSVTVGMSAPGVFSSDLDIPISQNSLVTASGALSAIPGVQLANGLAPGGMQTGFAILSDLEAYFFIQAVQDDNRSNVLEAPKVTMFNGQQAFVSDTQQRPFVVSVIPVVGDFAAAQQPVIVVLNEGTSLSVQAVVSNDRRFVRLTMVPFFSQIGDVDTFTFEGTESSSRSSNAVTGPGTTEDGEEASVTRSGTTVQLPTFAFQTVTTTVSVPDGGTVLLGGIKRMTEVRRENGVPLLNKLPYINRLFENVTIGKSSTSLMMMVTPRIIIQSEEEEAIGLAPGP